MKFSYSDHVLADNLDEEVPDYGSPKARVFERR